MKKHYKMEPNYFILFHVLDSLTSFCIDDEEYQKRFNSLFDYVESKLNFGTKGGDIVDTYVVNVVEEE